MSTRTRVIASARRVGIRRTGNPVVTKVDVDETHFVRGTLDVVYTGRVVFQCSARQDVRPRIRVAPASGTRPRDVFRAVPNSPASGEGKAFGAQAFAWATGSPPIKAVDYSDRAIS